MTGEAITGTISLLMTLTGFTLAQVDSSMGGAIVGLVTQFGGLGLAVWLVYQHTTVTIPNMQKEHREERQAALLQFKEQLDEQRKEYLESLCELTSVIKENGCKAKPQ